MKYTSGILSILLLSSSMNYGNWRDRLKIGRRDVAPNNHQPPPPRTNVQLHITSELDHFKTPPPPSYLNLSPDNFLIHSVPSKSNNTSREPQTLKVILGRVFYINCADKDQALNNILGFITLASQYRNNTTISQEKINKTIGTYSTLAHQINTKPEHDILSYISEITISDAITLSSAIRE